MTSFAAGKDKDISSTPVRVDVVHRANRYEVNIS
jgi:hypothetical protein